MYLNNKRADLFLGMINKVMKEFLNLADMYWGRVSEYSLSPCLILQIKKCDNAIKSSLSAERLPGRRQELILRRSKRLIPKVQ